MRRDEKININKYKKEGIFWNFLKGQLAWVHSLPNMQQSKHKQYLFS